MHPELIFVAGPQTGQRVVLSQPVAVLGRGAGADVLFSEEFISRSQARYEHLQAGSTLENLSVRGTWINGKRYKTGKRILLETGDLIGAGQATQILFVAAGDDPDTALAMYREYIATGRDAFGRRPRHEKAAPEPQPPEPEPAGEEDDQHAWADTESRRPSEMSDAERIEAEKKARRRKIAVGLGIYLTVFAVVATILVIKFKTGDKKDADSWPEPPMLTGEKIAEFIRTPVQRTRNQFREEEELEKAVGLYQQYGLSDTYHLYDCLGAFKEALAYGGRGYFEKPEHGRMYKAVLNKFTKMIQKKYGNAYVAERAWEWDQAEREFDDILRIYRNRNDGLFENIKAHNRRVKHFQQASKPKRRRWFGR